MTSLKVTTSETGRGKDGDARLRTGGGGSVRSPSGQSFRAAAAELSSVYATSTQQIGYESIRGDASTTP